MELESYAWLWLNSLWTIFLCLVLVSTIEYVLYHSFYQVSILIQSECGITHSLKEHFLIRGTLDITILSFMFLHLNIPRWLTLSRVKEVEQLYSSQWYCYNRFEDRLIVVSCEGGAVCIEVIKQERDRQISHHEDDISIPHTSWGSER